MSYVPDANIVDRPVGSDPVQVDTEFRRIKARVKEVSDSVDAKIDKKNPTQKLWPVGTNNESDRPTQTNTLVDAADGGFQCFVCSSGTVNWNFDFGPSVADEPGYLLLRLRNGGLCTHNWPADALFSYGVRPIFTDNGVDYVAIIKPRDDEPVEVCHSVAHLQPLSE